MYYTHRKQINPHILGQVCRSHSVACLLAKRHDRVVHGVHVPALDKQKPFHLWCVYARKVIYDVDDDNALLRPAEGVPHANASLAGDDLTRFHGDPSLGVHNPYGCFGAPGVVWPRGFPLTKIQDPKSSTCGVRESGPTGAPKIGVLQALANHDPDVDAIYRLTFPPGGLPFYFDPASPATAASPLRAVPASTFTPYNAQVSHTRIHMEP